MSSAAAITLAAAPALAQEATPETDASEAQLETTGTTGDGRSFDETYGEGFAELGERNVEELLGTTVVNDAGEMIGQVDNFGLAEDQIVAIVGIGGFLGIGEHNVALPLDSLTFDGEQLLISGVTREELEAMPEYGEGDGQTFAADQTLRGGYEGIGEQAPPPSDTASVQPSDNPAADQPMDDAEEEVAEAAEAEADAETTVEDELAEGEALEGVGEQAGEDVAEATQQAGTEVEEAGEELAQTAEEAGEAVEDLGTDAAEEVAEATDEAATELEETAETAEAEVQEETQAETATVISEEAEQPAEGIEMTTAETADQPAEGTEMAAQETAEPLTDEIETAEAERIGWSDEMESIFADIADRQIDELIGMDVASADGDVVGQVDNFALAGENVVAIVGVGGFLGIGEHDVALSLEEMTYDGERLVISSMTEEQLREMPEYEDLGADYLSGDGTLRSTYEQ